MAGNSAARFAAGLMIPTLFTLKYLTRSQTINTAYIASYRNRTVLKYGSANTLIREANRYNGRLRLCSGFEVLNSGLNSSVVSFTGDHQKDSAALMTDIFP
ncbi:hypothetical protein [Endozoicomonas ascidiicola]|nr:hypothetical protein [Endozoicomonas ascidiicola]